MTGIRITNSAVALALLDSEIEVETNEYLKRHEAVSSIVKL